MKGLGRLISKVNKVPALWLQGPGFDSQNPHLTKKAKPGSTSFLSHTEEMETGGFLSLTALPSLLGEIEASSCLKEKLGVSQWDSVKMCSLSIRLRWDYSVCDGIDDLIKQILKILSSHLPWEGTAKFCWLESKNQTLNKHRISVYGIVGNEAAPPICDLSSQPVKVL